MRCIFAVEKSCSKRRATERWFQHYLEQTSSESQGARIERMIPESEEAVLQMVKSSASENGIAISVVDVAMFRGKLRALVNCVWQTPTVIYGSRRLIGAITREQLGQLLEG